MPSHPPIIVIADDLSGAAELAGIAFACGLSAEVHRQYEPSSDVQVIAVDTDSRNLPPSLAADHVRQVTEQALATQPAWIFKKVDSVLRGNVRAEIEAMLQATRQPHATLIPANPSRGRTISAGRYRIDGVPLDQTTFSEDPDHPRLSSDVQTLLGPAGNDAVEIVVPDVESELQLKQCAARCDSKTLAAGAADFFAILLRERCPLPTSKRTSSQPIRLESPALLVCGSRVAWPIRRAACNAADVRVFTVNQQIAEDQFPSTTLLGLEDSESSASDPKHLHRLAQCAAALMAQRPVNALLAEGGATAAAIADRLGWTRFAVVATAPAGVGVLHPLAPAAPLFLIKPGSYPWPAEIWQAFLRCHHG